MRRLKTMHLWRTYFVFEGRFLFQIVLCEDPSLKSFYNEPNFIDQVNRGDVIRSYVSVPTWSDQSHVIVQVPPSPWAQDIEGHNPGATSYVLLEDPRSRLQHPVRLQISTASICSRIWQRLGKMCDLTLLRDRFTQFGTLKLKLH